MNLMATEFEHEARATRRYLERLPPDKLDWRPHRKSSPAGALASHLVECIGWVEPICTQDELDLDPSKWTSYQAATVPDLLHAFDRAVDKSRQALATMTDESLLTPWRFKIRGRQRWEKPRGLVFRDFAMNHLVHHRGQFSVYLRLLDVPLPGTYGPTADEQG